MIYLFKKSIAVLLILVLTAFPHADAFWHGTSTTPIPRGMNVQRMWSRAMEASTGTSFARLNRIRLVSQKDINHLKVVYCTFFVAGASATGLYDLELAYPLNIQAALEYPYTASRSSIPARTNFKFAGNNTYAYGGTGTNPIGYKVSDDLVVPGGTIPRLNNFGIWSSAEAQLTQPLSYSITALSSSGQIATATMADTTGLYVGGIFNVTGASVTGYNNAIANTLAQGQGQLLSVTSTTVTYKTASSNLASATTASGFPYIIPINISGSSAVERFEGSNAATSSAGSFVATNAVATLATLTNYTTAAAGSPVGYLPCALIIDYGAGDKVVMDLGDSTEENVNAGSATVVVARDGDVMGLPNHAGSWLDQGFFVNNGLNYGNGGKGSDGAKFTRDPTVWPLRKNVIALFNPTIMVNSFAFNDQGLTPAAGAWVTLNTYYRGQVATRSGSSYLQLNGTSAVPCTSTGSGPTGTLIGPPYVADGNCSWSYMGASTFNGAQGIGWNMVVNDQLHALLPSAKLYNTTMMPSATYNNPYGITALSSVGTTATATVASGTASLLYSGQNITISSASVAGYNVTSVITAVGATTFDYTTVLSDLAGATTATVTTLMYTLQDQIVTAASTGQRNNFNTYMKTRQDLLGWTSVFDLNTYIENDPIGGDNKWIVDNSTPNFATNGAHVNSFGNLTARSAIPAGSFNFLLKRDINPASNDNDPMWLEKAA